MGAKPHHYSILVLDAERFGSRTNPEQERLRDRMYGLVECALTDAGITPEQVLGTSDRGDGGFWLFSSEVSKVDLSGSFVDRLQFHLRKRASRPEESALRLRVALHSGEVARDSHGWVGADLNTACRLVDLDALRSTLAAAHRSALALAVSEHWYTAVIRHRYPGLEASAFRQIPFQEKEVDSTAWLRVPGYDAPPGLDGMSTDPEPGVGTAPSTTPASSPAQPPAAEAQGSRFAGAVFHHVGRLYGGDHHEVVHGSRDGDQEADR